MQGIFQYNNVLCSVIKSLTGMHSTRSVNFELQDI